MAPASIIVKQQMWLMMAGDSLAKACNRDFVPECPISIEKAAITMHGLKVVFHMQSPRAILHIEASGRQLMAIVLCPHML